MSEDLEVVDHGTANNSGLFTAHVNTNPVS
jgi:hypothetical protein